MSPALSLGDTIGGIQSHETGLFNRYAGTLPALWRELCGLFAMQS